MRVCRICFDGERNEEPLISPCKCSGSVKFIHESCLNSWLLSQGGNLKKQCEICKYFFNYHPLKKTVWDPKDCIARNPQQVCYCCILLLVMAILFVLLYVVVQKDYADPKKNTKTFIGILVGFFALFFCSIGIIYKLLKSICMVQVEYKYKIFPVNEMNELNSTSIGAQLNRTESLNYAEMNINQLEDNDRINGY